MADIVLTQEGISLIASQGVNPTHMQLASGTLPRDQWAAQTTVSNVIGTFDITQIIKNVTAAGVEVGFTARDSRNIAYNNFATIGVWVGDPTDPASKLVAFGTAASGEIFAPKVATVSLDVPVNVLMTTQQATNITVNNAQVGVADESIAGVVLLASQTEAQELTPASQSASKVLTVVRGFQQILAWWGSITGAQLRSKAELGSIATRNITVQTTDPTQAQINAMSTGDIFCLLYTSPSPRDS